MQIEIDVAMEYRLGGQGGVLLTLQAARLPGQVIRSETLLIQNASQTVMPGEGGIGQRVWAQIGGDHLSLRYKVSADVTRTGVGLAGLARSALHDLPPEVLTYLRPSRFCPSDLFTDFVDQQFGHLTGGAKVATIGHWVRTEIGYVPGSSNAETTAIDTFSSRAGVCRDFAHLVCSLARAANIPARYTSVYGLDVQPPDFHAVAEVWLGGAWHIVDATGMATAETVVIIGAGRDASDVAFMEAEIRVEFVSLSILVSRGQG
jgi:transglutaminase-like putative cysteine protease